MTIVTSAGVRTLMPEYNNHATLRGSMSAHACASHDRSLEGSHPKTLICILSDA